MVKRAVPDKEGAMDKQCLEGGKLIPIGAGGARIALSRKSI